MTMKKYLTICVAFTVVMAALAVTAAPAAVMPKTVSGKVIWLYDGDSFRLKTAGGKILEVRMYGIDAPEHGQPGGRLALQAMIKLLKNRTVKIVPVTIDKYQRIVGKVYLGQLYVNLWSLQHGYAWHFRFFDHDKSFAQAEKQARQGKLGIWKLTDNVPPWQYRRLHPSLKHQ